MGGGGEGQRRGWDEEHLFHGSISMRRVVWQFVLYITGDAIYTCNTAGMSVNQSQSRLLCVSGARPSPIRAHMSGRWTREHHHRSYQDQKTCQSLCRGPCQTCEGPSTAPEARAGDRTPCTGTRGPGTCRTTAASKVRKIRAQNRVVHSKLYAIFVHTRAISVHMCMWGRDARVWGGRYLLGHVY